MEQFIATLLSVLLSLPAYYTDQEAPEARAARMTVVATAIAKACYTATCSEGYDEEDCVPLFKGTVKECGAALVTLGFWESRFAKHIHEGNCLPGECDEVVITDIHRRVIRRYFRAHTVWQMHWDRGIANEWQHMNGSDLRSTTVAAWAATKKWSRCWPNPPQKAFRCYAGTKSLVWSGAKPRAEFFEARMRAFTLPPSGEVVAQLE